MIEGAAESPLGFRIWGIPAPQLGGQGFESLWPALVMSRDIGLICSAIGSPFSPFRACQSAAHSASMAGHIQLEEKKQTRTQPQACPSDKPHSYPQAKVNGVSTAAPFPQCISACLAEVATSVELELAIPWRALAEAIDISR